jgi:hypothetical protein
MPLHSVVLRSSGLVQNAFIYYQGKERVQLHAYSLCTFIAFTGKMLLLTLT